VNSCLNAKKAFEQYRYSVYGLSVLSEIEIPELTCSQQKTADVVVSLRDVPESLLDPIVRRDGLQISESKCLLNIPKIGRFLIENGRSISIDRREDRSRHRGNGTRMTDLRVYLLGSAFGALLHQREWLPLHVSAIQAGRSVWAFSGDSGAGKSTLAAFLNRRYGFPIVSDDVSVLCPQDSKPLLHPGPRKLKLWKSAIDQIGFQNEELVQDLQNTEKYQLYLGDKTLHQPLPIRGLILLNRCEDGVPSTLERVQGIRAFEAVESAIYRPRLGRYLRSGPKLMQDIAQLADSIDVYQLRRRWSLENMAQELGPVLELMALQEAGIEI